MKIYIAGPYSHPDPVENTAKAIDAGERVREMGHTPFIPHLDLIWQLRYPHEPDFWYAWDLEWLAVCDALLRLPGASKGADAEVKYAAELGIPVYFNLEDIP